MELWEYSLRILVAFILGGMIGFERQYRQKSAGLRTNTLVSIGSAAFVMLSHNLIGEFGDPSRVAGQIVTGIGFLGAGVIIREGASIQGLNTAATIWCSAAVGSLVGAGFYDYGVITAFSVILTLIVLRPLAIKLSRRKDGHGNEDLFETHYHVLLKCKIPAEFKTRQEFTENLKNYDLSIVSLKSSRDDSIGIITIEAKVISESKSHKNIEEFAQKISSDNDVIEFNWSIEK